MNTSCRRYVSTLELREKTLAVSAAIGRCWQHFSWPTRKFVTGFCALLTFACPLQELNLGLFETPALERQRSCAHVHKLESIFRSCTDAYRMF